MDLSAHRQGIARQLMAVVTMAMVTAIVGCQSTGWLRARRSTDSPLARSLKLESFHGPEPTPRTLQWLRRYDLVDAAQEMPHQDFVDEVTRLVESRETAENTYVLSELSFLAGKRAEQRKEYRAAFDMYGISVANAYLYLVDQQFDTRRNPYDPRFRQACDLYNGALESVLRLAQKDGPLTPGTHRSINTDTQQIEMSIVSRGKWPPGHIERIEFASDYYAKGLTNQIRRFGLGVPLIAVYQRHRDEPEDQFYSPGMSVAATAFLRVESHRKLANPDGVPDKDYHICTLELHDPLTTTDIQISDGRYVPLETDLSTPLAFSLSDPMFQETDIGTRGLLNPRDSQSVQGIYMLEPFDPDKIPVLMVHGLWSSLNTWMEMFNDLRGYGDIRDNYQFWFYLYPTGQPFWTTAAQLRQDLGHAREVLDPHRRAGALDQMVLVGHSMGGLVSKLQTLQSGDDFWRQISDQPIESLELPKDLRSRLQETWFFEPNRSIRRVVTIATPHRGSEFSNSTTQWLARNLIKLPETVVKSTQRLLAQHSELRNSRILRTNNSVESLATDSPIFPVMLQAARPPDVVYHNIVGVLPKDELIGRVTARGDGVVRFESAHLDDAESEAIVPEDHVEIHRHPLAVLEVQRILTEHLNALRVAGHKPVKAAWSVPWVDEPRSQRTQ